MKKGIIFIATGLLLIAAALFLTGYNVWDNCRAGRAADAALAQLLPMIKDDPVPIEGGITISTPGPGITTGEAPSEEIEYPDYVLNPDMDMPVVKVDGRDFIGTISIPAIDRALPVLSEWNYPNLKISACRYTGSAYLDNMVICAHNYNIHFGSLKALSYGDTITFTDMDGNAFAYKVIEIETLDPYAIDEMTAGQWDLTLFTCTIGGATRVAVRCERM